MTRPVGPSTGPNVGTQPPTPGTADLPTLHHVHARVRMLLEAAGLHTRPDRIAFFAEVLGRDIRWGYEMTGAESDLVIRALEAGISEPHEETPS